MRLLPVVKPWSLLTTDELYAILKLRTDVFFLEQKIDETELDDRDREPGTRHYWLAEGPIVTSYLRVLQDAEPEHLDAAHVVGRVVVHPGHRGVGLAQVLLQRVIDDVGDRALLLHAQDYIVPLYARFGFVPFGPSYPEAGIAHQSMYRPAGG
ncbi:GNAT family N-acetyltransferase [Cryobacterium sp.]|jgi:ElaA protein|uniref:GNAT family N-acetyltransferase n=1 Tax=Cryobacterium sp. TaxID=1926290 RepID=UPI002626EA2D|nr:GNAT family N-acetyltransferase [Cryobacterium sp.]MCU1446059.1 family N-acetyltransferase [Cryobacterium sp.]